MSKIAPFYSLPTGWACGRLGGHRSGELTAPARHEVMLSPEFGLVLLCD